MGKVRLSPFFCPDYDRARLFVQEIYRKDYFGVWENDILVLS
jgi:hypothetical protein